jgi:glucokinase
VAIDIGGTKIAGGVVDHPVGITLEQTTWTNARQGGQAVLSRAMKMIGDLLKQAEGVAAIGVATAGEVGADGDIIYATNNIPGYKGIAVRREIEARFGLPTAVDNDGRCAALGEALAGAGQGYHSVLGVTVGTGIGGGFVIEGRPYAGAGRVGAHLGHILVEKGGKLCSCGKHGCLEAYVCGPALVEDYNQRTSLHVMSGEAVMNAARSGNLAAAATIREMGERLGYGLASAANLFNPGVIVIGGGMSQIGGMFFEPVRAAFRDWTYPTVADTPILPAQLGSRAELIGAAILARQRLAGRSA